ncbi:hypothetical protein Tco_1397277 [Tanacetum coccineum]
MIMDLKLKYKMFRAKPSDTLSKTYTYYKTLLNELTNDGVTISKHEINVDFVNSLLEKWLSFSQGLRNANHTQTLDLADIYGRFVYEDNLIFRRYSNTKNVLISTPSDSPISTAFFSNNIDKEEVSGDEEETRVKYLMALADDELFVGKNHTRNGEWIDITIKKVSLKQAKLEAVTFQIQNTKLTKLNDALQDQLKEERKLSESSSKNDAKDNTFVPASLDYDHEVIPKSKDGVERINLDSKLLNFNTGRILVPNSKTVNKCLQLTEAPSDPKSSNGSGSKPQTLLPPLKNLQGTSPRFKVMTLTYQDHFLKERSGLGRMKHTKPETQESSNKNVSGRVTYSVPTEVKTNDQESKIIELTKLV